MNGPRPIVGSDYRPARFEHRTPLEYRALRPEHSLDADRLQSAMLPRPLRWIAPPLVDRIIGAACAAIIAGIGAAWLAGLIK